MNDLEDALIDEVQDFFGDRAKNFCTKPGSGFPPAIDIDFTLYNYSQIILIVERNTAFFALKENMLSISITKTELKKSKIDKEYLGKEVLSELDAEIRLRIPDKFLAAKGWL